MTDYTITTERLGLRQWIDGDIEPYAQLNADPEVMKYFPKTLSYDETLTSLERIRNHFNKNGFGVFAVEKKDAKEFLGFTGFMIPTFESFFTPCVEIGWRYKKEAWGKGYATEAATACLGYGFNTLGFGKIHSFTSVHNTPSERVMQRIGMSKIGKFDHPNIDKAHFLCRHVAYEIAKS